MITPTDDDGKGRRREVGRKHFRRRHYGSCKIGNVCEIGRRPRRKALQRRG